MRWEYRIEKSRAGSPEDALRELNALGEEGWELCGIHPGSPVSIALVLKKRVVEPSEGYDPIRDETKEFGLQEWADTLCHEVQRYALESKDTNDYHVQNHTWDAWMATFARYMSW